MIDEKKLIEELASERTKAYIAYEMEREYWDKGYKDGLEFALKKINEQPKVGEWIPVEDRLPNEEEFEKNYCRNHWGAEFIVMIKGANKPTSLYYKEGVWFDDNNNDYDVIAWQPLPERYEEKEND